MPRRAAPSLLLLVLVILVPMAAAQAPVDPELIDSALGDSSYRRAEVFMEAGAAFPRGHLNDDFATTNQGFGADTGFQLGVRVRFYVNRSFSLAPVVSYTEFGAYEGITADGDAFLVQGKVIRYGADVAWTMPGRWTSIRPILGAGAAFVRNKYYEEFTDDETFYKAGVNNLAWSLLVGLRWRAWELSLDVQINEFSTSLFFPTAEPYDYVWNHVVLRLGYALPAY
jgi:hypothetical protein